ncbi:MAG: NAD(+) synthase [Victivallales bacterium]|nr:NAD(+) synthase [Victivallales bacterium]
MYGFQRIALCVPECKVADVDYNCDKILALAKQAAKEKAGVVVFPELSVTTASCGDLFRSQALLTAAENGVVRLLKELPKGPVFVFGTPMVWNYRLFDVAVVAQNGRIRGIAPNTKKGRVFSAGPYLEKACASYAGQDVEFCSTKGAYDFDRWRGVSGLCFDVEFGDELEMTIPPSSEKALHGANLIVCLAAKTDHVGTREKTRDLVRVQSERCKAAYAYVSAGVGESTTDTVCGGQAVIAENGVILAENKMFQRNSQLILTDIDVEMLSALRVADTDFGEAAASLEARDEMPWWNNDLDKWPEAKDLRRPLSRSPFIPEDAAKRAAVCEEVFEIQKAGLAKRVEHARAQKLVLGISGGLDSTLALLVSVETMKMLKRKPSDVMAITMPGFGTSDRTYENACNLCRKLGVELREISIKNACLEHFANIGHDPNDRNVVYENAQARERTQILLDLANKHNGLVVGTGDLSEIALGWCTFNGDHISQYGVNGSIPKSLMRSVIAWVGAEKLPKVKAVLQDIIDTPVSPELLPADEQGKIKQKTEDILGPYEIHDFFLYHFFKYGASPKKILFLAEQVFGKEFEKEQLKGYLKNFLRRFVTQQFKRSCMPDGVKTTEISLSPRGGLAMPSDASFNVWLKELDD